MGGRENRNREHPGYRRHRFDKMQKSPEDGRRVALVSTDQSIGLYLAKMVVEGMVRLKFFTPAQTRTIGAFSVARPSSSSASCP